MNPPIKTKSDEVFFANGGYFDPKPAEKVREFLRRFCCQSIGEWAGKPLELMPYQWEDIILPLYGMRNKDGSRRFRTAGVWIPKNNGKSTLLAGLSLYHLVGENEPGAQVVNLAATIEQASIIFRQSAEMVEQSSALSDACKVRRNIKTIEYAKTHSTQKVLSGERGKGKHGFSISFLTIDELAEHANRDLYDTMRHNMMKRKNSLMVTISTAGFKRESIAFEQFEYCQKLLKGEIVDTAFLPVVYAASPEDQWDSLDTFKKVNPAYGVTIEPQVITELIQEARNEPRKENAYKTLHLNLWTGSQAAWVNSVTWASLAEEFSEDQFHGCPVWCGIDYAYKHDLASYCLITEREGLLYLLPRFFCPKINAEAKQKKDGVPYLLWASQPRHNFWLTDGDVIDPKFIRQKLAEDSKKFKFVAVGYDPIGLEETRQILEEEHNWDMVSVPQKPRWLSPGSNLFERSILGKKLRHPNNPVLNWCLENCSTKETSDGIFVFKGKGETQRIDGVIAACIGLAVKLQKPYEESNEPQLFVF